MRCSFSGPSFRMQDAGLPALCAPTVAREVFLCSVRHEQISIWREAPPNRPSIRDASVYYMYINCLLSTHAGPQEPNEETYLETVSARRAAATSSFRRPFSSCVASSSSAVDCSFLPADGRGDEKKAGQQWRNSTSRKKTR